jgi:hypothetical protein
MTSLQLRAIEVGEWWECYRPFRHYRAMNPLTAEQFSDAQAAFKKMLDASNGECPSNYRFARATKNYDALILPMEESLAPAFHPLFSEPFIRSLCDLLEIPYLSRIDGALHSSPRDSRTGWIHTDYCSAWFDESRARPGEILFPERMRVQYFDGTKRIADATPVEYVRAATMIFYCCNEGWKQGDGGETALYGAAAQSSNTTFELVPPVNNSILFFECSPHSYHRFVTNPGRPRNSIILWLHSTLQHAEARWGATAVNRRRSK